jgi:hypothetical protein
VSADLLPPLGQLTVTDLSVTPTAVAVALAATAPTARCPACGTASGRVHAGCDRRIFCERLPQLAAPHARTTDRLADRHRLLGLALGGEPGSRLAGEPAIPTSGDTILRRVTAAPDGPEPTYRYVGIGDFALRKGHTYGTTLIDLDRGRAIDLLGGRDGAAVEAWLRAHPGVEVIARDRWTAYANAAAAGAPQATQVADRWHPLKNLREAVGRLFERSAGVIREALARGEVAPPKPAAPAPTSPGPVEPVSEPAPTSAGMPGGTEGRRRRVGHHRQVHELYRLAVQRGFSDCR